MVLAKFCTPARCCHWFSVNRRLANVSECPPPTDQAMAALMSLARSTLGPTRCPNRDCRTMDDLLLRTHSAMAFQTKLANTTAIISLSAPSLSLGRDHNGGNTTCLLSPFTSWQGAGCSNRESNCFTLGGKKAPMADVVLLPASCPYISHRAANRTHHHV